MVGVYYKLLSYLYFGIDCHNNCLADVPVINSRGLERGQMAQIISYKNDSFQGFLISRLNIVLNEDPRLTVCIAGITNYTHLP